MMKKVVIILFLVGIIFSGFLYFLGGQEPVTYRVPENNLQGAITKKASVDRDADGLADWEEEFWGSNPLKADSDGDGTNDSVEISLNRNPNLASSSDPINNPTDKLLALTRRAALAKQAPLLSSLPDYNLASAFKLADLKIKTQPTNEFIENYGKQIREVMGIYNDPKAMNEARLTLEFINQGKSDKLTEIKKITAKHRQALLGLLELEVPKGAEKIHLNLVNALARLSEASFRMSLVESEPAVALEAVNKYGADIAFLFTSINNVNLYFTGRLITLDKNASINISLGL